MYERLGVTLTAAPADRAQERRRVRVRRHRPDRAAPPGLDLGATRLLHVVGTPQRMHFQMVFAVVRDADLSNDRLSDCVFDRDRMRSITGNTGPYLQIAYARIRSIVDRTDAAPVRFTHPAERALAPDLLDFEPVLLAPDDATRAGRLALCERTARTLGEGLGLLGIGAPDRL